MSQRKFCVIHHDVVDAIGGADDELLALLARLQRAARYNAGTCKGHWIERGQLALADRAMQEILYRGDSSGPSLNTIKKRLERLEALGFIETTILSEPRIRVVTIRDYGTEAKPRDFEDAPKFDANSGANSGTNLGANSGANSGANPGANSGANSGANRGAIRRREEEEKEEQIKLSPSPPKEELPEEWVGVVGDLNRKGLGIADEAVRSLRGDGWSVDAVTELVKVWKTTRTELGLLGAWMLNPAKFGKERDHFERVAIERVANAEKVKQETLRAVEQIRQDTHARGQAKGIDADARKHLIFCKLLAQGWARFITDDERDAHAKIEAIREKAKQVKDVDAVVQQTTMPVVRPTIKRPPPPESAHRRRQELQNQLGEIASPEVAR